MKGRSDRSRNIRRGGVVVEVGGAVKMKGSVFERRRRGCEE
jgi:hypothetical protein